MRRATRAKTAQPDTGEPNEEEKKEEVETPPVEAGEEKKKPEEGGEPDKKPETPEAEDDDDLVVISAEEEEVKELAMEEKTPEEAKAEPEPVKCDVCQKVCADQGEERHEEERTQRLAKTFHIMFQVPWSRSWFICDDCRDLVFDMDKREKQLRADKAKYFSFLRSPRAKPVLKKKAADPTKAEPTAEVKKAEEVKKEVTKENEEEAKEGEKAEVKPQEGKKKFFKRNNNRKRKNQNNTKEEATAQAGAAKKHKLGNNLANRLGAKKPDSNNSPAEKPNQQGNINPRKQNNNRRGQSNRGGKPANMGRVAHWNKTGGVGKLAPWARPQPPPTANYWAPVPY